MKLRPIMFVGTCSDAGKSLVNTAFCRIFKEDGFNPAPFKAQNMSLNSYSTPEGGEIGRAQAVQAEACGVAPTTDMNPVLLKPTNDKSSQVVLNGRPIGNMSAKEYFMSNNKQTLFDEALKAFKRLDDKFSPIVLEGAGSISELNLKERDITNMRMAKAVSAATYLVADIDRGGVFASVYGSIMLLSEEERRLIKGIIINKFRGDVSLFDEGRTLIKELTGIPVVGVLPYFNDIKIENEDSVSLTTKSSFAEVGKVNVAVVLHKRLSNFTDFAVLESDKRFHLYYTNNPKDLSDADIVILPGSKNTIADMQAMRDNGMAEAVIHAYKAKRCVIGICGGFQMLGVRIEDPEHSEGSIDAIPGLGILPMITVLSGDKVTEQRKFKFMATDTICDGYEIHSGVSKIVDWLGNDIKVSHVNITTDGVEEGFMLNEKCWGTYMHGILDNAVVLNKLAVMFGKDEVKFDYQSFKESQYGLLAKAVRDAVDINYIYDTLKL